MNTTKRLRILLLEDQALVRAGMKALIQISEPLATIREAASYEEAVAIITNATFDIAFLDIDLKEERSGLDFLRYIRSLDLDTRAIASRMSELYGEDVGQTIGYRIRFENRVSAKTRIEVVTEGILTRMLQADNALEQAALVIFDEFHERSIHADLALSG